MLDTHVVPGAGSTSVITGNRCILKPIVSGSLHQP